MRYLHTMVRVTDIDASLRFYCEALGLEVIRKLSLIHISEPTRPY